MPTPIHLHVAPSGSSTGDGSPEAPYGSLHQARTALRRTSHQGADVVVHAGSYRLAEPLCFTAEDGGTEQAPVRYRAEGEVVLSGGVAVDAWQPVADPAILARLAPAARAPVRQADLRALGIPDADPIRSAETWGSSDPGLELFFQNQPMTLARYPNQGWLHIGEVLVEDGYDIRGATGSRTGHFRYQADKDLTAWQEEPDSLLHGFWFWDWADQRIRLRHLDAARREMVLDDAHPHHYGYRPGQWFYAANLLCELDQPGEWYLDRRTGILYFWPPEEPRPGDCVVSVTRDPIIIDGASHLTLEGFVVEAGRGTAIQIRGGDAVTIACCTIRNCGGFAITAEGGLHHRVTGCDIYHTGDGGVVMKGGDRPSLTPAHHLADHNHIHHTSRWNPLYKPGLQLSGVGHRAAHNSLHDLPHIGIGFTGNDHLIEYNEICRAVTQANDAGMIYTSGAHPEDWSMRGHIIRHNYLHHSSGFRGDGCMGIYLDDMFSGVTIEGNLFVEVPRAVFIGGGRDCRVTGNLFIDCAPAFHLDARATGWAAFSMPDVIEHFRQMPWQEEPWASRYPELVGILEDEPALPKGNVVHGNRCLGGHWDELYDGAGEYLDLSGNQVDPDAAGANPEAEARASGIPVDRIGPRACKPAS